jgi:hypothetical protein
VSSSRPPSSYRRVNADSCLIAGRLEAHGRANYQFRDNEAASYYLKVLTSRGVHILWGKDLERAMLESRTQPKIGSQVGVRRTGYETFTIPDGTGQRTVKRNTWMIETAQFFADRARLARRVRDAQVDAREATKHHPELVSTYLSLRGARAIAERRITDPKDRERFLALVREAMATSIRGGQPLPEVRLRDRDQVPEGKSAPVRAVKRDAPSR